MCVAVIADSVYCVAHPPHCIVADIGSSPLRSLSSFALSPDPKPRRARELHKHTHTLAVCKKEGGRVATHSRYSMVWMGLRGVSHCLD